jgi:FkbM family methyltransferase
MSTGPTAAEIAAAYQAILGRAPESEEMVAGWSASGLTLDQIGLRLLASPEFLARAHRQALGLLGALSDEELGLLYHFQQPAEPISDSIISFVGARTRVEVMATLMGAGGMVEGLPLPCNFHGDLHEWLGLLRAVRGAQESFVAVELGAGWGPWLVAGALAARRRGISQLSLTAVEGDAGKIPMLEQHFRDNGLDPSEHHIVHGVVAAKDGQARFPEPTDASVDWGAASLDGEARHGRRDGNVLRPDRIVKLPAYSLQSLLDRYERVDFVHCDIQGDEVSVLSAARRTLDRKVSWLVVGTHGRDLELDLLRRFSQRGWALEYEQPCRLSQQDGAVVLAVDGVQVWSNPRLTGAVQRGERRFFGSMLDRLGRLRS